MDGKSQEWRDAADKLLEALARENQYIVADMLIIFLESAGFGLDDYSPVGAVFRRAASRGLITKIDRPTKPTLWLSKPYMEAKHREKIPVLYKGQIVGFSNFGRDIDATTYRIADVTDNCIRLERHQ
jgi:hypothetical protein